MPKIQPERLALALFGTLFIFPLCPAHGLAINRLNLRDDGLCADGANPHKDYGLVPADQPDVWPYKEISYAGRNSQLYFDVVDDGSGLANTIWDMDAALLRYMDTSFTTPESRTVNCEFPYSPSENETSIGVPIYCDEEGTVVSLLNRRPDPPESPRTIYSHSALLIAQEFILAWAYDRGICRGRTRTDVSIKPEPYLPAQWRRTLSWQGKMMDYVEIGRSMWSEDLEWMVIVGFLPNGECPLRTEQIIVNGPERNNHASSWYRPPYHCDPVYYPERASTEECNTFSR
ncbi:hypothetical protein ABW19_dt0205938 [Dactylella cylindrospora]|nr:hypothetical protein ABW19_dt0205938 [Dactylella cylindrospora]